MLDDVIVARNSSYLVPCVFRAVRMIEALRVVRTGLRVEEFVAMTGYPRSTVYRILRTLTACHYIVREVGGVYRLNHAVINVADATIMPDEANGPAATSPPPSGAAEEFERWGLRFRRDGRRVVGLPRRVFASAAAIHQIGTES